MWTSKNTLINWFILISGSLINKVSAEQWNPGNFSIAPNNISVGANITSDFSLSHNDSGLLDISYLHLNPPEELVETYEQYNTAVSDGDFSSGMAAYFKLAAMITNHTKLITDIVNDKKYYNLYLTDEIVKAAEEYAIKHGNDTEAIELFEAYLGAKPNATNAVWCNLVSDGDNTTESFYLGSEPL